jgi:hypothetical protein
MWTDITAPDAWLERQCANNISDWLEICYLQETQDYLIGSFLEIGRLSVPMPYNVGQNVESAAQHQTLRGRKHIYKIMQVSISDWMSNIYKCV